MSLKVRYQIADYAAKLAAHSQRFQLITVCFLGPPVLIGVAWLLFPILDSSNLSFQFWNFACFLGIILSLAGCAFWGLQRLFGEVPVSWLILFGLITLSAGSVCALIYGQFYWAFERGYFLS